jgi:hypothetical protein
MPGARDLGWLPDDDPVYQNAEWTIYIGALPAVKPKPVEPEPEMEERRHRQSDQED